MAVTLNRAYQQQKRWVPLILVTAGPGRDEVSCELHVRRPSFAEQIAAKADEELQYMRLRGVESPDAVQQIMLEHQRNRIRLAIVDWRGVSSEPDSSTGLTVDVPYSVSMLELLCSQYPQGLSKLEEIINDVLITFPGDLEKNWQTPPVAGGTEQSEIIPTTESSNSTTNSQIASDSAAS